MSGDKRIPHDKLAEWSRDVAKLADELERVGSEVPRGAEAGAVTAEILSRSADALAGVDELVARLRGVSDTLRVVAADYAVTEAGGYVMGEMLGWSLDQLDRPPYRLEE